MSFSNLRCTEPVRACRQIDVGAQMLAVERAGPAIGNEFTGLSGCERRIAVAKRREHPAVLDLHHAKRLKPVRRRQRLAMLIGGAGLHQAPDSIERTHVQYLILYQGARGAICTTLPASSRKAIRSSPINSGPS